MPAAMLVIPLRGITRNISGDQIEPRILLVLGVARLPSNQEIPYLVLSIKHEEKIGPVPLAS
jgi:hypothetical protein